MKEAATLVTQKGIKFGENNAGGCWLQHNKIG